MGRLGHKLVRNAAEDIGPKQGRFRRGGAKDYDQSELEAFDSGAASCRHLCLRVQVDSTCSPLAGPPGGASSVPLPSAVNTCYLRCFLTVCMQLMQLSPTCGCRRG